MDDIAFEHHLTSPQGHRRTPAGAFTATVDGGACCDQIALSLSVEGDRVTDAGFDAHGCGAATAAVPASRGASTCATGRWCARWVPWCEAPLFGEASVKMAEPHRRKMMMRPIPGSNMACDEDIDMARCEAADAAVLVVMRGAELDHAGGDENASPAGPAQHIEHFERRRKADRV